MDENKFTVKEVTGVEKSKVEVEVELLQKHEEKFEDSNSEETTTEKVEFGFLVVPNLRFSIVA